MAEGKAVPHLYVALRVRPLLAHEREAGDEAAVTVVPASSAPAAPHDALASASQAQSVVGGANYVARVLQPPSSSSSTTGTSSHTMQRVRDFELDCVFGPAATQESIFRSLDLAALCEDAFRGVAGTVFCFGQTGGGKTYTMSGQAASSDPASAPQATEAQGRTNNNTTRRSSVGGSSSDAVQQNAYSEAEEGVQYRAVRYVAELLAEKRRTMAQVTVKASYLELYNERLNDLLQPGCPHSLRCRWSAAAQCFYVENALLVQCEDAADLRLVLQEGATNRQRAAHLLNADSSRSHVLFTLYIETRLTAEAPPRYGKLTFVDLAGSERLKETGSQGADTKAINRSLFLLGTVIERLAARQQRRAAAAAAGAAGTGKNNKSNYNSLQRRRQRAGAALHLEPEEGSNVVSSNSGKRREADTNAGSAEKNKKKEGEGEEGEEDFIPYRYSILTQLLMDSLEGNCRTVMIACVSPARRFVEESMRTMHYAQRARHIVAAPVQRVDTALQEKYMLQQQVRQLREENCLLRQALRLPLEATSEVVVQLLHERTSSNTIYSDTPIQPQQPKSVAHNTEEVSGRQPQGLLVDAGREAVDRPRRAKAGAERRPPPALGATTTKPTTATKNTTTTTITPQRNKGQPAPLFTRARLTPLRLRPPAAAQAEAQHRNSNDDDCEADVEQRQQEEEEDNAVMMPHKSATGNAARRQMHQPPLPTPPAHITTTTTTTSNTIAAIPQALTAVPSSANVALAARNSRTRSEPEAMVPPTASSCPVTRHAMPRRVAGTGSVDTHVPLQQHQQQRAPASVNTPHALSFSAMPSRPSPQSALELLQQLPDSSALPHRPPRRL